VIPTFNFNCILVSKISPWRWPDCWPKQVGADITIKIRHKIKVHLLVVNTLYTFNM